MICGMLNIESKLPDLSKPVGLLRLPVAPMGPLNRPVRARPAGTEGDEGDIAHLLPMACHCRQPQLPQNLYKAFLLSAVCIDRKIRP